MLSEEQLCKYKDTVQKIIDKYFPEDKKFSVHDFNNEQLWYVCRLLLEKDNEKRKDIWNEIKNKLKHAKYTYEIQYNDIMEHKELFDNYNNTIKNFDNLTNDMEAENEMDLLLNNC